MMKTHLEEKASITLHEIHLLFLVREYSKNKDGYDSINTILRNKWKEFIYLKEKEWSFDSAEKSLLADDWVIIVDLISRSENHRDQDSLV